MPIISAFFGIVIRMFWKEHGVPHFHAQYGDDQVVIGIDPLAVIAGSLQPRALALVMEWASQHQAELLSNWELCRENQHPHKIAPLD